MLPGSGSDTHADAALTGEVRMNGGAEGRIPHGDQGMMPGCAVRCQKLPLPFADRERHRRACAGALRVPAVANAHEHLVTGVCGAGFPRELIARGPFLCDGPGLSVEDPPLVAVGLRAG